MLAVCGDGHSALSRAISADDRQQTAGTELSNQASCNQPSEMHESYVYIEVHTSALPLLSAPGPLRVGCGGDDCIAAADEEGGAGRSSDPKLSFLTPALIARGKQRTRPVGVFLTHTLLR